MPIDASSRRRSLESQQGRHARTDGPRAASISTRATHDRRFSGPGDTLGAAPASRHRRSSCNRLCKACYSLGKKDHTYPAGRDKSGIPLPTRDVMWNTVLDAAGSAAFLPHGHCFLWTPALLWSYLIADTTIVISYYSIPLALVYFAIRRKDFGYRWLLWMFGASPPVAPRICSASSRSGSRSTGWTQPSRG